MPVSGHKHYVIETKEIQTRTKEKFSNTKFISKYSHHYHLQNETQDNKTYIHQTKQCVLTRPFSFNYHLVIF